MRGVCGYGRYDDDPDYVGCPRAQTDMTPCIARDGHTALADDKRCVGCNSSPFPLLSELEKEGVAMERAKRLGKLPAAAADYLQTVVREATS